MAACGQYRNSGPSFELKCLAGCVFGVGARSLSTLNDRPPNCSSEGGHLSRECLLTSDVDSFGCRLEGRFYPGREVIREDQAGGFSVAKHPFVAGRI